MGSILRVGRVRVCEGNMRGRAWSVQWRIGVDVVWVRLLFKRSVLQTRCAVLCGKAEFVRFHFISE